MDDTSTLVAVLTALGGLIAAISSEERLKEANAELRAIRVEHIQCMQDNAALRGEITHLNGAMLKIGEDNQKLRNEVDALLAWKTQMEATS